MEAILTLARLAAGILAVQDPSVARIDPPRALAYAQAAFAAAERYGVDPWELVAVARNESAFKEDDLGPDGKDCGITQTRVTGSHYSCRQLRHSFRLGFLEGARELAQYAASCRGRPDYDRCRFNRYNSGVHYAKHGWAGRYWLRVRCYEAAAHAAVPADACARVETRREIAQVIQRGSAVAAVRHRS